jgi:hypothetical protein
MRMTYKILVGKPDGKKSVAYRWITILKFEFANNVCLCWLDLSD